MSYRVTVDSAICVGAGRCVEDAPSAFVLGDEQLSQPLPAASELDDETLVAIGRNCPSGAISLTGPDGEPVPLF